MIVVTRFRVGPADEGFADRAGVALDALAARAGFRRGRIGRSTDDPALWTVTTEWDGVGSYRRALGAYEVKLHASPLLAEAIEEPGAYEIVRAVEGGAEPVRPSARARG